MKSILWPAALALSLALIGCGGSSPKSYGDVSGVIFDDQGNPVRDARVYYLDVKNSTNNRETYSNSTGAYTLTHLPEGDLVVRAEVFNQANQRYFGSNVPRIFSSERAKNLNIVVVPDSQIDYIEGTVYDRQSNVIQGARIFARQANGANLSSSYAISDSSGHYQLGSLRKGTTYTVTCNALGFGDSTETITIGTDPRTEDFTIGNPSNPSLPAPQNVSATIVTSPQLASRSTAQKSAIEAVKQLMHPGFAGKKRVTRKVRDTINGNAIEVDLVWDQVNSIGILGYAVYRGVDGGSLRSVDFFRDPLGQFFADSDATLVEGRNYTYGVTALNTSYNSSTGAGEGPISNTVTVKALGDLGLGTVGTAPLTFNWSAGTGASQFVVYIFDNYPAIGESSRFNNASAPSTTNSFVYNGPALQSGRTYYYIVVGSNSDNTANTFSPVGTFVAP